MNKKKVQHICETCLNYFDDYSGAWVDRGGYNSLHCDGCIQDEGLIISHRIKERKEPKPKVKSKKK